MTTFIKIAKEHTTLNEKDLNLFARLFGYFFLEEIKKVKKIKVLRLGRFVENKYGGVKLLPLPYLRQTLLDKWDTKLILSKDEEYYKNDKELLFLFEIQKCIGLTRYFILRLVRIIVFSIVMDLKEKGECHIKGFGRFKKRRTPKENIVTFLPERTIHPRIKRILILSGIIEKK